MKGLVLKSTGSFYKVLVAGEIIECTVGGRLRQEDLKHTNPVSVGDYVMLADNGEEQGLIIDVLERRNYLIRKATRMDKQTHIVAANLDQLIIIASLKLPRTSTGFIDRVLATGEAYNIPCTIIFNKKDLLNEEDLEEVTYLRNVYREIGYTSHVVSAYDEADKKTIRDLLTGKVSLLTGHSGVGKSSIINTIDPELHLKTGEISKKFSKGKHTTTFAEMHPLAEGGYVVDTPGIKEFGLFEVDKYHLTDYFPELFALKKNCRFNNCLHLKEPGCAVIEAFESGNIAPHRYLNYVQMLETV